MALPAELEREIFELTVRQYPEVAPSLMVVTSRVYAWVAPLLYENVSLGRFGHDTSDALLLRSIQSLPPSFLSSTVKSLCMTKRVSHGAAHSVLPVCRGLRRLACWSDAQVDDHLILSLAGLWELSCGQQLFARVCNNIDACRWAHQLTHLELILWDLDSNDGASVDVFPALTHFSIVTGYLDAALGDFVDRTLEACPRLELFSVQFEAPQDEEAVKGRSWDKDPRVVISFRDLSEPTSSWTEGKRWEIVKDIIEDKRRLGDRAPSSGEIVDTFIPSGWDTPVIQLGCYASLPGDGDEDSSD
ncbi:hypothetical protein CYLTODRAFT_492932 [Cylindrobasidium torrendii FP15055 ss-10]|uniref:F-box domain-containing protein n=1 Tax=Cylindrobasidium torrendii FP15055 ss-10 TaxID=1314674 RepID=A0A0D7B1Z6_9AGAR|nr:hypothetical protein CYLTODRAFT_492932 [Cylindrobasidium torrendii FP15055 ss-10]